MIRNIAILVALIAAIGLYTWYEETMSGSKNTNPPPEKIQDRTRRPAPDFTVTDISGKSHNLSAYKGRVIILNFWATWCAPCVIEFPQMLDLAKKTRKESVVIFLSQDDTDDAIARFLKKNANDRPDNVVIARDADKSVAQSLYQTYKLPETYIIDPNGRIADKIIGADTRWNDTAMVEKIKSLMRE